MSSSQRRLVTQCLNRAFAERLSLGTTLPRRPFSQQNRAYADNDKASSNPVLDEMKRKQAKTALTAEEEAQYARMARAVPEPGNIDKGSVFEDDRRTQYQINEENQDEQHEPAEDLADPDILAAVLDSVPKQRHAFLQRKIVQSVKHRGRVSKELMLKRTEREHLNKSHNMKTSTKKLGMIARQIAGMKIDDAIVQMRFSKKGVAREVLKQLEFARDEAVVMRGMGLGLDASDEAGDRDAIDSQPESGHTVAKPPVQPMDIRLKSGSRHTVSSPSDIYIDQAWVGRGKYGKLPDFRARGRMFILRTPFTSLSVVLKEEKTRVREWKEREEKRKRARTGIRVWQHLPDRPISNHRAWYNW